MTAMDMSAEVKTAAGGTHAHVPGRWPVWKSLILLAGGSVVLWAAIIAGLLIAF